MSVERLLAIARNEIGYLEKASNSQLDSKTANAGHNNWTKYGAWFGINPGAWCDMFVSWCAEQAGISDVVGKFSWVKSHWNFFYTQGRTFRRGEQLPVPGDIAFLGSLGHIGIVSRVTTDRVYVIEGNTSTVKEYEPNGGCCREKSYALTSTSIYGYGRPAYRSEVVDQPVDEENDEMTQDKFNEMFAVAMKNYRESLQDNEAGPWSDADRSWAIDNQIIKGGTPLPDGNPNYMWEDFLTREQAAALLHRLYEMLEKQFDKENLKWIVKSVMEEQPTE